MSEKTYTVTLTETQLRELNRACDVVSRIMCGQLADVWRLLPHCEDRDWVVFGDDIAGIEAVLSKHCGTDISRSGLGIMNTSVDNAARTLYDMHQVFRKKLHDNSATSSQHTVDAYDAIATGSQPLVVVK